MENRLADLLQGGGGEGSQAALGKTAPMDKLGKPRATS